LLIVVWSEVILLVWRNGGEDGPLYIAREGEESRSPKLKKREWKSGFRLGRPESQATRSYIVNGVFPEDFENGRVKHCAIINGEISLVRNQGCLTARYGVL